MSDGNEKKTALRQKVVHELVEYWINVAYLAVFFGAFSTYRRLVLTEYHIHYLHYGIGLIKALVLAKVIMIGDILHLGRRLEDKPLIVPVLYKAFVFSLWVGLFSIVEHTITALLHGKCLAGGVNELLSEGMSELLAGLLVVFFAFIPFFAFKALERVLGEGKVRRLFFSRRVAGGESGPEGGSDA